MTSQEPTIQQYQAVVDILNQGDSVLAEKLTRDLLDQFPKSVNLTDLLGRTLFQQQKYSKALTRFDQAIKLAPNFPNPRCHKGNTLVEMLAFDIAIENYDDALALDPSMALSHQGKGIALSKMGNTDEAIESLRAAIDLDPSLIFAQLSLSDLLTNLGQLQEAKFYTEAVLKIEENNAGAHNQLGNILRQEGNPEAAIPHYKQAMAADPAQAAIAYRNLGTVMKDLGKTNQAKSNYENALKLLPGYAEAHYNLSLLKTYEPEDTQIAQMIELIQGDSASITHRIVLGFALAKAFADLGDYDASFDYLSQANQLKKQELAFNIRSEKSTFRLIRRLFNPDLKCQIDVDDQHQPIFIVGMPRSGTTLVEQILASHSTVFGAGELSAMSEAVTDFIKRGWQDKTYVVDEDDLATAKKFYLDTLTHRDAPKGVLTDKMPGNFKWLGFILQMFPAAKIVHVQRDPIATCWSIYKNYFPAEGHGYSHDQHDLAVYYEQYRRLMAFWDEHFPSQIYHLNYEALTIDQDNETRKLLDFCELSFEQACLEFHKLDRAIQTTSSEQVRKKMYSGSSDAWRTYEDHLQPLIKQLARSGVLADDQ